MARKSLHIFHTHVCASMICIVVILARSSLIADELQMNNFIYQGTIKIHILHAHSLHILLALFYGTLKVFGSVEMQMSSPVVPTFEYSSSVERHDGNTR